MSKSEEETYSTIFTSLKHPIRRKILRMLSRRARSFSEMQEVFKIESSHLTYHLENLGDLLFKTKDGKYMLSSFGEAATSMMYHVEETPKTRLMLPSLSLKWKACFAVLMVGLILSAGLYYVQYQALSQISAEYDITKAEAEQLQSEYNRTRAELEQLQNDYAEIEAELKQLQNEYTKLKTDAEQLQSDYNETKEELRQLQNEYEQFKNFLEQYLGLRIIFVNGSNVGDPLEDGSFAHPFDMIQEGVNAASPGDLVFVASGTYYEHVTVDKSLTLVGESRSTTIIDGNRTGGWSAKHSVVYVTANNVKISGFKIQNSGGEGYWAFVSGIALISSNNTIHGNTISNNNYGIILATPYSGEESHNNLISGNIVQNNLYGIYGYSTNNIIINNTISSNEVGLWLIASNNNNISANSVLRNRYAGILITNIFIIGGATSNVHASRGLSEFFLPSSNNNTISGNTISGNGYGIEIEASIGNTVVGNVISNNEFGIFIREFADLPSGNNTIYHNNFIDNMNQASAAGKNTWDNGYPSGGNYWSNYIGVDLYSGPYQNETGSDGIGDTPYIIDENNTDDYPLMGMFSDFPISSIGGYKLEKIFHVTTISNSTITSFGLYPAVLIGTWEWVGGGILVDVIGLEGTKGFCRFAIPKDLLDSSEELEAWTVELNGTDVTPSSNMWEKSTYTFIYVPYDHSTQEIMVMGTWIVPEFPSVLILSLLMIITLVAVALRKTIWTKRIKE